MAMRTDPGIISGTATQGLTQADFDWIRGILAGRSRDEIDEIKATIAAMDAEREKTPHEAIEDAIHRLIAILDEIEGDADFEPDADDEDGGDHEPEVGT